eukprot:COSAG05_NODE_749_length_7548_cov_9.496442_1_plen_257_part_00
MVQGGLLSVARRRADRPTDEDHLSATKSLRQQRHTLCGVGLVSSVGIRQTCPAAHAIAEPKVRSRIYCSRPHFKRCVGRPLTNALDRPNRSAAVGEADVETQTLVDELRTYSYAAEAATGGSQSVSQPTGGSVISQSVVTQSVWAITTAKQQSRGRTIAAACASRVADAQLSRSSVTCRSAEGNGISGTAVHRAAAGRHGCPLAEYTDIMIMHNSKRLTSACWRAICCGAAIARTTLHVRMACGRSRPVRINNTRS